jgi:predicted ATPase
VLAHGRGQILSGDWQAARQSGDEVIAICERHGFSARIANGFHIRGLARARLGELDHGIDDCRRALDAWRGEDVVFTTPELAASLAELLVSAGRASEAAAVMDFIDTLVAGTDEAGELSECQRVRGIIHGANGDPESAERWLDAAITTARAQSALLFELRATTRLAEVLATQGRRADAARRLANVYGSFTEGHGTPDLTAAREVLDRLS